MKCKKVIAGLMAGVLASMSLASGAVSVMADAEDDPIKVGCVFPITGNNADQGVFNVDGCQFAIDYINEMVESSLSAEENLNLYLMITSLMLTSQNQQRNVLLMKTRISLQ